MPVGTRPRKLVYNIKDGVGKPATMSFNIPLSFSGAQTEAFADALAPIIDDLIDGYIVDYEYTVSMIPVAGIAVVALGTADVEEGALFNWRTANGYPTKNRVPTFKESLMIAGTEQVNLADPAVDAFNLAIRSGLGAPAVAPSDGHGDDITTLVSAYDMHTKER